jgi:hypothetical protein
VTALLKVQTPLAVPAFAADLIEIETGPARSDCEHLALVHQFMCYVRAHGCSQRLEIATRRGVTVGFLATHREIQRNVFSQIPTFRIEYSRLLGALQVELQNSA